MPDALPVMLDDVRTAAMRVADRFAGMVAGSLLTAPAGLTPSSIHNGAVAPLARTRAPAAGQTFPA